MNPDTDLYVTDKGAILMQGGVMFKPGDVMKAAQFKGIEANLQTLLAAGNLSLQPVQATGLDVVRGEQLPPVRVAKEGESVPPEQMPKIVAGGDEQATLKRVNEIRAAQAAKAAAAEKRQKELADLEGQDLTVEEAKALGVLS